MEKTCGQTAAKLFTSFFGSDFGVETWCKDVPAWSTAGAGTDFSYIKSRFRIY